ncbi:family 1 glycosylhydrolase [Pseudolysinimonas sp.]|uniref:family 1 glycosylhydrolase n=1 Tax=Pseudolysinimonas sp. TaxID=2680009 RepID=UPI003F808D1A
MSAAFAPGTFAWLTGIEDTCVYPPARYGMPPLDEIALTGHDANWRDDLRWVRDLGCDGLRYGALWPRVHLAPGRFDWRDLDERIGFAHDLGLTVVADLVHYGAPTWVEGAFADPAYPDAAAEFAGRFAERYRGVVEAITPFNEPVTTASFSGLRGIWPPALTGWDGWVRVAVGIALGMTRSVRAIRDADPDAVVVHVEASALYATDDSALHAERALLERIATIPTDLLLGRVDPDGDDGHWLRAHGADPAALAELRAAPARIDVLGVNYYPDLTPRVLEHSGGRVVQRAVDAGAEGLERVLRSAEARWGLPMVVTETSIEGDPATRSAWLRSSTATVDRLRGEGMDLRGYTWWPLVDFVDWSWAAGGRNVEEFQVPPEVVAERAASGSIEPYLRRMGLARLEERDGVLHRVPDASATAFVDVVATARRSAGAVR